MIESVSHSFADESLEAKTKWFQSLSLAERMDLLVTFTNLILENNPEIAKKKHARTSSRLGDVRALTSGKKEADSED
jgi:hypothetical protein